MSGEIRIKSAEPKHLQTTIKKLQDCGCNIKISENELYLKAPRILKSTNIETEPYPGFPTDMQSIFVATLLKAEGISYVTENIFENRYKYVDELIKMGTNIEYQGKCLKITGKKEINATNLIAKDLTPSKLKNKRIISLDMASAVAGTKYRGEFEERMKKLIDEIESHDEIILFIDEIHTLIGAGGAEGAIDASNILKPALARGKIKCIGATTTD